MVKLKKYDSKARHKDYETNYFRSYLHMHLYINTIFDK